MDLDSCAPRPIKEVEDVEKIEDDLLDTDGSQRENDNLKEQIERAILVTPSAYKAPERPSCHLTSEQEYQRKAYRCLLRAHSMGNTISMSLADLVKRSGYLQNADYFRMMARRARRM